MRYIPNTDADCKAMLQAIGVQSVEELFADIPAAVRLKRPLKVPPAMAESEVARQVRALADKNANADRYSMFLGAGCYNHFSPAILNHLVLRGEFLTPYTPYQPEVAQGTLQALYEYQTLICLLTGMDVSNACMYEGASATAEAALMAHRITGRSEVLISRAVHPEYRQVVETYTSRLGIRIVEVPFDRTGATDPAAVKGRLTKKTSCLILQNPNFFGVVEDLKAFAKLTHDQEALYIVAVAEPVSLGIVKPPGECGADIVIGEGQGLGTGMNYGGPALGLFATREKYIRYMPGRLVGQTEDRKGRTGYVLTLATREQHIRREKATSNICTSESLIAIMATMYMVTMGPQGIRDVALMNLRKAAYAKDRLGKTRGYRPRFDGPTFNEFVLRCKKKPGDVLKKLLKRQIIGGLELQRFYPELADCLLICVTEQNSRGEIDGLAKTLGGAR